ncbi:MAG: hypothetical protein ACPF91_07785 [Flavobacteriales bacterium]
MRGHVGVEQADNVVSSRVSLKFKRIRVVVRTWTPASAAQRWQVFMATLLPSNASTVHPFRAAQTAFLPSPSHGNNSRLPAWGGDKRSSSRTQNGLGALPYTPSCWYRSSQNRCMARISAEP